MSLVILAAFIILVFGLCLAYRKRADIQKASLTATAFISLAISVLEFPYYLKNDDLLIAVIEAFHAGVSGIALSVNGDVPYALGLEGPLFEIYRFFLYILYILGPIFGSMFLITFSANVKNALSFFGKKDYFVFSSLNEKAIAIAESIFETRRDAKFIFCNTADPDISLADRVRGVHGVMMKGSEQDLHLRKNSHYEFFEIADDERSRIIASSKLCEKLPKKKNFDDKNTIVRIFADDLQRELILNIDRQYSDALYIRHIDEGRSLDIQALSLAREELSPKEEKHTAIVSDSSLGITLLKDLLCLSVGYKESSIDLIGPGSEERYEDLLKQAPETAVYPIKATDTSYGTEADAFDSDRKYDCVFIMYEEDEDAFKAAVQIKKALSYQSSDLKCPKIYCRIKDGSLHKVVQEEDIVLFGDIETMCRYDVLVNPKLEKAAERVHLSYVGEGKTGEDILENTGFYEFQNQESSFAQALSMTYKASYILSHKKDDSVSDKVFIENWLAEHMDEMAEAEHERWNAYQRVHGWRRADDSQSKAIIEKYKGRRSNDPELLLHPAIVEYDELARCEAMVNSLLENYGSENRVHYLQADKDILQKMSYILDLK